MNQSGEERQPVVDVGGRALRPGMSRPAAMAMTRPRSTNTIPKSVDRNLRYLIRRGLVQPPSEAELGTK